MSFLGGIIRGVGNLVGGAMAAGPIGAAIGAIKTVGDVVKGGGTAGSILSKSVLPLPAPRIISTPAPVSPFNVPAVGGGTLKGGVPALPMLPGAPVLPGMDSPSVRIIKSQKGATPGTFMTTGKGHYTKRGVWTDRRRARMNPMNVHAARRAVRRIHAAEKLFRKILSISHPGHAAGRIKPRRARKRA